MAYKQPDGPDGAQNGFPPSAQQTGGQQLLFTRPLTLQEALPYSPFTSVVPFESGRLAAIIRPDPSTKADQTIDIIPTPDLGAGPSSSNLSDLVPRHDYENLNKEAANLSSTSRRVEQTVEHFQNLLAPGRLTTM